MDLLPQEELQELMMLDGSPRVSIYLPTHRAGTQVQQNPVRLKNLLKEAKEQLLEKGLRVPDAERLLQGAEELLPNRDFWQHQSDGLALYIAPDIFRSYRLPLEFNELVVVSNRFHIKPLLPLFTDDGTFYLLAISLGSVRLFRGARDDIRQVQVDDLPKDMAEALRYDDPERRLQHQTLSHANGGSPAIFHGHGVTEEDEKVNILRYFQIVDKVLRGELAQENAPLVLASVEYLQPIYKQANDYPHLVEEGIRGNPEETDLEELHHKAWQIVGPRFQQAQDDAVSTFRNLSDTEKASQDLEQILPAAFHGRVDTLFVPLKTQCWGKFDLETNRVELHSDPREDSDDLLDLASVQTLANGGQVYAFESNDMPVEADLAAIFRY
jgi:hypothetical protein